MIFTSKVPLNAVPTPVAKYLSGRFTYLSLDEWISRVLEKKILINDSQCSPEDCVEKGDTISYVADEFEEPPADLNYRIVFEDEWFLGIDKPGNLLVHRAGKSFKNNLMYQLRFVHDPLHPQAQCAHRLDRETSGVVVMAKSSESRAVIQTQFSTQEIDKEYIAIVHNAPSETCKVIDMPIGKDQNSEIDYKFKIDPDGKSATTEILSSTKIGSAYSFVKVHPITGRTHQIRIHLAEVGAPIVGDKLYGLTEYDYLRWRDNPQQVPEALLFNRHALHCAAITFNHPYTNKRCRIEAGLPEDMQELIKKLERI